MPHTGETVLVAMSGGVDSSVAAAVLQRQGCEVVGVHLRLGPEGEAAGPGCGSTQHAVDAETVADQLHIRLLMLDWRDRFAPIVEEFTREYARGRTPNPCVHCNALIKFGGLLQLADEMGIRYVATGHYARIGREPEKSDAVGGSPGCFLLRGSARDKDQSYALFAVRREVLPRVLLPVGEFPGKEQVREFARERGLCVEGKGESQDICFASDEGHAGLLRQQRPEALRPGKIVDSSGAELGRHDGYGQYTIGQRRGLGVAAGVPVYVTRIDPETATVTVGPREEILSARLTASNANWHEDPDEEFNATVQIRYNHGGASGRVRVLDANRFEVRFAAPVSAITPGQAAVVYRGDRLLGGGWID